jgi:2-oxoglutarate ferredoxin oxidoreductase subunit delta
MQVTNSSHRYEVIIDDFLCKGCKICIDKCPYKVLELSGKVGDFGALLPVAAHEEKCTGCNVCAAFCPDFAISVEKRKEKV